MEERQRLKTSEYAVWRKRSLQMRRLLSMPKGQRPWNDGPGADCITCAVLATSPRMRDCLDVGFMLRKKQLAKELGREPSDDEVCKGTYVDISQSCDRMPMSTEDKLTCPTTRTTHFSFERKNVVCGRHHMALMGWPRSMCDSRFEDHEYRTMAGDGFSAPLACLLSSGCFLNPYGPWWR